MCVPTSIINGNHIHLECTLCILPRRVMTARVLRRLSQVGDGRWCSVAILSLGRSRDCVGAQQLARLQDNPWLPMKLESGHQAPLSRVVDAATRNRIGRLDALHTMPLCRLAA